VDEVVNEVKNEVLVAMGCIDNVDRLVCVFTCVLLPCLCLLFVVFVVIIVFIVFVVFIFVNASV
jgi:hypothetical protein